MKRLLMGVILFSLSGCVVGPAYPVYGPSYPYYGYRYPYYGPSLNLGLGFFGHGHDGYHGYGGRWHH